MSYPRFSSTRAGSPALSRLLPHSHPSLLAPCQLGPSAASVCQPAPLATGLGALCYHFPGLPPPVAVRVRWHLPSRGDFAQHPEQITGSASEAAWKCRCNGSTEPDPQLHRGLGGCAELASACPPAPQKAYFPVAKPC